jgi:predicted phage terminase large subunit-like protein
MEANFAQDMILDEFKREGEERGYQLPLRKDIRKKPDKWARVEAISPLFERGNIHLSRDMKDTEDCRTFVDQLLSFEKGSKAHDDAPDALEGAVWILNRRGRHRVKNIRSGSYAWKDNSRRL